MNANEFTLEFFQKCLSQVKWESTEERDILAIKHLIEVAKERGWIHSIEIRPPLSSSPTGERTTNTQTPKPKHTMLKEIYETLVKPIVDALDRNTAVQQSALGSRSIDASPPAATTEPEAPKKPKKAKAPEPEPTPEPEPPAEEPYMSGPDLCTLMAPLKDTPFSKKLVEFRNNEVGFKSATREMTDPDMLRKMEAKIREFLAENEAAGDEP